jgi:hypothetical protein
MNLRILYWFDLDIAPTIMVKGWLLQALTPHILITLYSIITSSEDRIFINNKGRYQEQK